MITDTLYGILNADGTMQLESNDRELRIVLSHSMGYDEGQRYDVYVTTYYIKDGLGWQQTLNSDKYNSADDFLDAIRRAEDFALAVRDIEQQKTGERVGG